MKFSEILDSGELEGYAPSPPVGGLQATSIDASVAALQTCQACGHHGLDYRPFTRAGSYRAFAVCPECDEAEEF